MIYNLSNDLEERSFALRVEKLRSSGSMVELKEKRARSLSQNNYCHVAISYFALQMGITSAEAKEVYFKGVCNADIFTRKRYSEALGREYNYLRSTADLTKDEMSTAIDRFLKFAAENGIYIASPDDYVAILHMEHDVERNKKYL